MLSAGAGDDIDLNVRQNYCGDVELMVPGIHIDPDTRAA
jgi:hypothetical protein